MICDEAQAAISLRADGEPPGGRGPDREAALDAHVATCAACSGFAAAVRDIRSRLRV